MPFRLKMSVSADGPDAGRPGEGPPPPPPCPLGGHRWEFAEVGWLPGDRFRPAARYRCSRCGTSVWRPDPEPPTK